MMEARDSQIVHVIGALVAGGAERFVVSLVCRLRARGLNVRLWVLSSRTDAAGLDLIDQLKGAGVGYVTGPTVRVGPATVAWYLRMLWSEKPHALHLHTPNTELIQMIAGLAYRPNVTLFRTLHSTAPPFGWLTSLAYRRNKARVSIACSSAVAAVASYSAQIRLETVSNGVQFADRKRDYQALDEARSRLSIDPALVHFVHVGRMSAEDHASDPKAQEVLLEAWLRSRAREAKCQLHMLGDGPNRRRLERKAAVDSSVRFHGVRSDVDDWLAVADWFILPSRREGLPLAAIEAIGAGLPCIFSDIPPLRELAPPLVSWVSPGDVDSLARAIRTASSLRPKTSAELIRDFRDRHSIERSADRYLRVYEYRGD